MKTRHFLALCFLVLTATAIWSNNRGANRATIYDSLDTLAEILTLVESTAPEPVAGDELIEGAIAGLLEQLDPHSSFYNEDRFKTMREDQKGAFFGIGVIVGYQNERLTIISPIAGGPAAKAGAQSGDVIIEIDGVMTDTLDFNEAIRLLRGEENSQVEIRLERGDMKLPAMALSRAEIPSNNVRASFMLDARTGYVALRDFGETAAQEVAEAIQNLEASGMNRLVLDLRGNPGGLLPQAIGVSSLFVPGEKVVVSTKGRLQNATQKYVSEKTSPVNQHPLIVLINRGSASASEIVAGAVQDHDRGLIVGVNSWGKGLVQSVFPLSDGAKGLALTTSRYYTPSGRNIQGSYNSLEEYYNPGSSEDQYFEPQREGAKIFKTEHGRAVYQTRGITPDVFLKPEQLPEAFAELEVRHSAAFNFSTEAHNNYGAINAEWVADDKVLEDFTEYLKAKDLPHEAVAAHKDLVRTRLTYHFLNAHDEMWSWRHLMLNDRQVTLACELFPQAEELLQTYTNGGEIRPAYTTELRQFARIKREEATDTATNNPQ